MNTPAFAGVTQAQQLDIEHFDAYWRELLEQGKLDPEIPPDEAMWRLDLGRSLRVTFDWLGDLRDKRVLELGCGPGDYAVMLARRGAHVTALDIAMSSLDITRWRALANHVAAKIDVVWMPAETLAFPNAFFDWVVGFGLLHHADPLALGPEVRRVLKPGGRALFREPLGTNPLLEFARDHLPYRSKHHSENEHPLRYDQIHEVGKSFRTTQVREFYLFSMISRAVGGEMSFPWLWKLDEYLIEHAPTVRRWCRYVLVQYAT
jgi:SAM-dependent methyltransferase